MQVRVSNNITITEPTPEIITWCQSNLKIPNPDYAKKLRMGFWLGNTPKDLYLYEIHGGEVVMPYGCLKAIAPLIKDAIVQSEFKPSVSIDYGEPIPLYPYQEAAVEAMVKGNYGILQSPAGSGKTQMGIELIKRYGKRTLWLTTTKDLLAQSKERAERYMDKSLLGTITEGKVNLGSGVTFATVQTMCKLDLLQYKHYWDVIICDECHHLAGTPTKITMFSKVLNNLSARHKFGLTATPHRADGLIKATFALIGEVTYSVPEEAIADRVLSVGVKTVATGITQNRRCLNTDGTLNYTKLINYVTSHEERNKLIADAIVANKGMSCIILSDRLEQLDTLMNMLPPDMRGQAVKIDGGMVTKVAKAERTEGIRGMRDGTKKYLFATYALAREGLDVPCLERLFMASPIKDEAWVIQSVGRIARISGNKSTPICFDFVDDIPHLLKMYKSRYRTYTRNNCYFTEDE